MGSRANRKSDRISISFGVEVAGVDAENRSFSDPATTVVVNRNGALLTINRTLKTGQTVALRRRMPDGTHRTAEAAVVVREKDNQAGASYGIAFVDPQSDFWGIEFPSTEQSHEAVVRVLVECMHCHGQELAYLNGRELKEFETNRMFARHCRTCESPSIWKQPQESISRQAALANSRREAADAILGAASPAPSRVMPRYDTRLTACVRFGGTEEIAVCENVSRLGIAFRSRRKYDEGAQIEVAVPYAAGTANVFVPAIVVHARPLPTAGLHRHGAKYVLKDQQ